MVLSSVHHAVRRVARIGVETPLLIPSFSSRGFPDVGSLIDALRVDVSKRCLVSAFDLANGLAPSDFEALADIVVIDSGLYETAPAPVAVDAYLPAASARAWTRTAYQRFLADSAPRMALTNTIVVNYDAYAPLPTQVANAKCDFANAPSAAYDFLAKPEMEGQLLDTLQLTARDLDGLDILGVTERELGRSALLRCRALVRLRRTLTADGVDLPIHVFGSITPAAVTAYFLCGADMFDGLNWLRVGLRGGGAAAPSEFAVAHGLGSLGDDAVLLELWRRNVRTLQRVQDALRHFAQDWDEAKLCATLPVAKASLELAQAAINAEEV